MISPENHNKRVIAQFTAQSKRFDSPDYSLSNQACLDWAIGCLPLYKNTKVMDVAAGTGLLSLAIGPHVHSVTAIDITQAMLDEGKRSAANQGIANVIFRLGNAYELSAVSAFDVAVSRLSFHHLMEPGHVLHNMARAVRPGGHVIIFDLLSPDDADVSKRYNELERLRDDSHTTALTPHEMIDLFVSCGLLNLSIQYRRVVNDLEAWMTMTDTKKHSRDVIRKAMRRELTGAEETGFHPFVGDDGRIKFSHRWMMIQGETPGSHCSQE